MDRKKIAIGAACGTVVIGLTVAIKKVVDKVIMAKVAEIIRNQQADEAEYETEYEWNDPFDLGDFNSDDAYDDTYREVEEVVSFPEMPRYLTDEEKAGFILQLKDLISGKKTFMDYKGKDAVIMECLLYEKLQSMPIDCHINSETWFIAQHIGQFTRRMKEERPIVYKRLLQLSNIADWLREKIIFALDN